MQCMHACMWPYGTAMALPCHATPPPSHQGPIVGGVGGLHADDPVRADLHVAHPPGSTCMYGAQGGAAQYTGAAQGQQAAQWLRRAAAHKSKCHRAAGGTVPGVVRAGATRRWRACHRHRQPSSMLRVRMHACRQTDAAGIGLREFASLHACPRMRPCACPPARRHPLGGYVIAAARARQRLRAVIVGCGAERRWGKGGRGGQGRQRARRLCLRMAQLTVTVAMSTARAQKKQKSRKRQEARHCTTRVCKGEAPARGGVRSQVQRPARCSERTHETGDMRLQGTEAHGGPSVMHACMRVNADQHASSACMMQRSWGHRTVADTRTRTTAHDNGWCPAARAGRAPFPHHCRLPCIATRTAPCRTGTRPRSE